MRLECQEHISRQRLERKPLVCDRDMHHDTCVTQVSRCMPGLLIRGGRVTSPAFPAHAQPAILRIWQQTHEYNTDFTCVSCYRMFQYCSFPKSTTAAIQGDMQCYRPPQMVYNKYLRKFVDDIRHFNRM